MEVVVKSSSSELEIQQADMQVGENYNAGDHMTIERSLAVSRNGCGEEFPGEYTVISIRKQLAEFHFPSAVLAKIVSFVAADGTEGLGAWIRAGKEGRDAVYSPETLSQVRLDKCQDYAWFSDPISYYYPFFTKCLEHNNPHARYIESLRLGFSAADVHGALAILGDIKDIHPAATLAYLTLSDCAGIDRFDVYQTFKQKYWRTSDLKSLGDELISHIVAVGPRRRKTYARTWHQEIFPECYDYHRYSRHWNHERCEECVYWYLSLAILDLS